MTYKEVFIGRLIWSLTENYEDWVFKEHIAYNAKTDITIWISDGWTRYHICQPTTMRFSIIDKFRLKKAVEECMSKYLIRKL